MKSPDIKEIPAQLQKVGKKAQEYLIFIVILVVLSAYGFMVWQIRNFSVIEPNEDEIAEKLQTLKRPKIDPAVAEKIKQLEANNIEVKTLFEEARNNPFQN